MPNGTMELSGQGQADVPFGSITNVDMTITTPPGVPASNTQTGETIDFNIQKDNMWWFFGTSWTSTVTWDVVTTRTLTYSTSDGLLLRRKLAFWRK